MLFSLQQVKWSIRSNGMENKFEYRFMVFNDTFNNILVISWQSVLLVEVEDLEYTEKKDLSQVTDKLYDIMFILVHIA
jgi:hypothetical protein